MDAQGGQAERYGAAGAVCQQEARLQGTGLRAADAAGVVEAVEPRRQLHGIAVYAARVQALGRVQHLVRQGGQLLYELTLLLGIQEGGVYIRRARDPVPVRRQVADDGASDVYKRQCAYCT